jgi:hypothetical protein
MHFEWTSGVTETLVVSYAVLISVAEIYVVKALLTPH